MESDGALAAAIAHQRRVDPERAEALCREIVDAEPGHAGALHLLGILRSRRGDHERAIALFRRAIAQSPGDAALRVHLGKALSESGCETEAGESYRAAIAIDARRADAHADLGVLRQREGDLPGAVASYREAIRQGASAPLVHFNLATALRQQGELTEAIIEAERAAKQMPGLPGPRILLAELRLEAGDAQRALEECRLCLRHEARNRHAMALEALALARTGDHEASRALLDLERLVRLRQVEAPPPYRDAAEFDADLARALTEIGDGTASSGSSHPVRSRELLRGAGGAPGALAARFAEAAKWYLDHRPHDVRHRFLRWRPRDFHVEGDMLCLPGGGCGETEIRERGWVSGVYALTPAGVSSEPPIVELGAPPPRHRGSSRVAERSIALESGRLVLFPSYLFHSLRSPKGAERQSVVSLDMVPD